MERAGPCRRGIARPLRVLRGWAALVLVSVGFLGHGCQRDRPGPGPARTLEGKRGAEARREDLYAGASLASRGGPGAMGVLASQVAQAWEVSPQEHQVVLARLSGREFEFFSALFDVAAHESRDLSGWLDSAAAAVGRTGDAGVRLALVREVSGRECCMRRSFMAAALRGLARGMRESAGGAALPVVEAEAVVRLAELARMGDEGVAQAALEALAGFRLPGERRSDP